MNELAKQPASAERLGRSLARPVARRAVSIRVATMEDLPFLDAMQKQHGRALGYFPTKQFEGYIAMGAVLIAEVGSDGVGSDGVESSPLPRHPVTDSPRHRMPLGYVISRDRYLKRDELGVVYQLCVKPGDQRKLVGATLLKAVFERSAYGCKLYCCWCAQDLPANHFWESMGFVPIAFRAGSTGKRRVHIFWQRRINDGDTGERATPYWYPCQTNSGAIREDRLVFPIPPGTHWTEVQAVAIPQSEKPALDAPREKKLRAPKVAAVKGPTTTEMRGLRFANPAPPPAAAKPKQRAERPKVKIDPQLVSKARELRDRYLEQVNDRFLIAPSAKYDVSRALPSAIREDQSAMPCPAMPLLPAA